MGSGYLICITLNDFDNRRITNLFKDYHPVERLNYANWPTIVQCQFYPILFLCEPTSFGLIESWNWPGKLYVFFLHVALTLTKTTSYIPHQYSPSKGTRLSLQNIALPESDSKMVKQKFADPASWWRKKLYVSTKLNKIQEVQISHLSGSIWTPLWWIGSFTREDNC